MPDDTATVQLELAVVRKQADLNRVYGWASVAVTKAGEPLIDLHGDLIDIYDLEEAVVEHVLYYRQGGEMHEGEADSQMIESMVFTPEKLEKMGIPEGTVPLGWWVGYQVSPALFAKVKEGDRLMFSIEGTALKEALES